MIIVFIFKICYSRAFRETNSVYDESEALASISLTGINVYYFTDRMHAHFILNNKTCFKIEHEFIHISQ